MRYSKFLSVFLSLLLCACLLCACAAPSPAPTEPAEPAASGITLCDMAGREVTLDAPAQKVVALAAADCEILYAINAGDTLVGRGEYCDYPESALSVAAVESGGETNVEQIIALGADAVVMPKMAQTVEQVSALESAGIAVVVTDAQDIDGVYEAIALIGALTAHEADAQGVIDSMRSTFDTLKAGALSNDETVYFEVSPLEYGLWTAGADTFMDEIAAMLGLKNAFSDVSGWAEVSEEQVIERDPDYIVTITMYFGEGPTPDEEIASRDGWDGIDAVKDGSVYIADSDEISRPGPRLADAARSFAGFVAAHGGKEAA